MPGGLWRWAIYWRLPRARRRVLLGPELDRVEGGDARRRVLLGPELDRVEGGDARRRVLLGPELDRIEGGDAGRRGLLPGVTRRQKRHHEESHHEAGGEERRQDQWANPVAGIGETPGAIPCRHRNVLLLKVDVGEQVERRAPRWLVHPGTHPFPAEVEDRAVGQGAGAMPDRGAVAAGGGARRRGG